MPPQTYRWSKQNSLNSAGDPENPIAFVIEDSELFEAEAVELTIEETDDSSLSLLIRNDSVCNENISEEQTSSPRGPSSILSPHSLAATSIVTLTQHAQTMELNLVSIPPSNIPYDLNSSVTHNGIHPNSVFFSNLESNYEFLKSYMSNLSVHLLNLVNHSCVHRPPSTWPQHILAYTDAPAFVRAVTTDIDKLGCHLFPSLNGEAYSICIEACDLASDLTTCTLSCCHAELELLECTVPTNNSSSNHCEILGSNAPNIKIKDCETSKRTLNKRTHNSEKLIKLDLNHNQICLNDQINIILCPFSGLQPSYLKPNPSSHSLTMTAIYLLLIAETNEYVLDLSSSSEVSNPKRSNHGLICDQQLYSNHHINQHRSISSNESGLNANKICAFLVCLLPNLENHNFPIKINHSIDQNLFHSILNSKASRRQEFTVLVALVDIVLSLDAQKKPVLNGIIHQRLHYMSDFKFFLQH